MTFAPGLEEKVDSLVNKIQKQLSNGNNILGRLFGLSGKIYTGKECSLPHFINLISAARMNLPSPWLPAYLPCTSPVASRCFYACYGYRCTILCLPLVWELSEVKDCVLFSILSFMGLPHLLPLGKHLIDARWTMFSPGILKTPFQTKNISL